MHICHLFFNSVECVVPLYTYNYKDLYVLIIVSTKRFLANFIAANATCPECGVNEYCGCETEFECHCGYGFTGVDGSCEGTAYMYTVHMYTCM